MERKKGFTLVELLVVIAIIGILIALLIPAVVAVFGIGAEEVTGVVTLKTPQDGYHYVELTFEDGSMTTYSTSEHIYNQMQMNEWYKVQQVRDDRIIKMIEHLPSEVIPVIPAGETDRSPPVDPGLTPEAEASNTGTAPQGTSI